jgi:membrane protein implicated in regulation of membrane protease activity
MENSQIWLILGVLLLIAELMSVSFFFAFLSIGALLTALLSWLNITTTLNMQLLAFSVISIGSLLFLRKPLQKVFLKNGKTVEYNEYVGDKATVVTAIPANGEGKVFYRGTEWAAKSDTGQAIDESSIVIIRELDGIKLIVGATPLLAT